MIWSECKEIWEEGPREYVLHLWNLLDFGMLSIFVASFTARFMAFLKASEAQLYVDQHVRDDTLHNVSLPPEVAYFTYGESEVAVRMSLQVFCCALIGLFAGRGQELGCSAVGGLYGRCGPLWSFPLSKQTPVRSPKTFIKCFLSSSFICSSFIISPHFIIIA